MYLKMCTLWMLTTEMDLYVWSVPVLFCTLPVCYLLPLETFLLSWCGGLMFSRLASSLCYKSHCRFFLLPWNKYLFISEKIRLSSSEKLKIWLFSVCHRLFKSPNENKDREETYAGCYSLITDTRSMMISILTATLLLEYSFINRCQTSK